MELNREEIIKGLECCGADDECVGEKCPYYANCTFCTTEISIDALTLIEQLTEEKREIFEEVEELLKRTCEKGYCGSISDLFAELKKKHIGEK